MKHCYLTLLLLFAVCSMQGQNATNVQVYQEGEDIIITYDLSRRSKVQIFVVTGHQDQYTKLQAVTGSVGDNIAKGHNLQIIWSPLKEAKEFIAQDARFKIETETIHCFSVAPDRQVIISKGNLQYSPSKKKWRFAPEQWNYIGNIGWNSDWIDLFGWGTGNNPTNQSKRNKDYSIFVDWGNNQIGDDAPNTWRTLTTKEHSYLFNSRGTSPSVGYVCGVKGVIILPDEWSRPEGLSFITTYNYSDWKKMEANGAIFLPAAHSEIVYKNISFMYGYYWLSTGTKGKAGVIHFGDDNFYLKLPYFYDYSKHFSVRLVKDL